MNNATLIKSPITVCSALPAWNMHRKKVIVRADLNIPLVEGMVTEYNDLKLHAILPTLRHILKSASHVILLTHLGKPTSYDHRLSTKLLISWFEKNLLKPSFISTPEDLHACLATSITESPQFILYENLRFFAGEKNGDKDFAQALATGIDFYVNDAFGTLHRNDTSLTVLPTLFGIQNRTIGFLIEHELATLNHLFISPKHPFFLFLGGKKTEDKLPLLTNLLPYVNGVFLCPSLVFSFMHHYGLSVGNSLVDRESFEICNNIIAMAQQLHVPLFLPKDYRIAIDKDVVNVNRDYLVTHEVGICTGIQTAAIWQRYIAQAKTIFYNGAQGFIENPKTLIGMKELCNSFQLSSATTLIAGGDSTAIARLFATHTKKIEYSTGGGSTISYLSGNGLPGLQPFL